MKISIVTPNFNQGKFIEEAINSVLSQKGDFDLEYIVVDGGSTDNTLEILRKYEKSHGIKWISEKDFGQSEAINKGFKMATGEVINWLCSDDLLFPGALQKITDFFEKNREAKVVFGKSQAINEKGENIKTLDARSFSRQELIRRWDSVYNTFNLPQPAVFVKRKILDEIGYINESNKYSMDYEWYIRINKKYKFFFINEILSKDRCHENAKSTKFRKEQYKESIKASKKFWGEDYKYYFWAYNKNLPYHFLCDRFDDFLAVLYKISLRLRIKYPKYGKFIDSLKSHL